MRTLLPAALLALTLTACGGSEDEPSAAPETVTTTVTETPAPEETTAPTLALKDACDELFVAFPDEFASEQDYGDTINAIDDLLSRGGVEIASALEPVKAGLEASRSAEPGTPEFLDAEEQLDLAVGELATRCNTVGSSAFG